MPQPTFLGIGAARSGTTSLYEYLCMHPQVGMAFTKELNWFGWNGDRWLSANPLNHNPHPGGFDQAYYEAHFPRDAKVIGEISPPYQFLLENVKLVYPGIKLILCVRDPLERMVSHIRMAVSNLPMDVRKDFIEQYATGDSLLLRFGLYNEAILKAKSLGFPLHVVDFHDIMRNQQQAWDGVCRFLDIDRFVPEERIHRFDGNHHVVCDIPGQLIGYAISYYAESNKFMWENFGIDLGYKR